ncbi:hypothetical protein ACFL2Q_11160 [Thermodesulfobacteriota bacterium]
MMDESDHLINLLDVLHSKWLKELKAFQAPSPQDLHFLDVKAREHACYTCLWCQKGICDHEDSNGDLMPDTCPLPIDLGLGEVFGEPDVVSH